MKLRHLGHAALVLVIGSGVASAQARDDTAPRNALWQMSSCTNPGMSYAVKRQRLKGSVDAVFDITADGEVENIRILPGDHESTMDDYVVRALRRWRYFGYVKDGELAPRMDVTVTFTYGPAPSRKCTHTSLPELPSTLGDPADPYQSLKQCMELIMPKKAARWKTEGHVRMGYDITPDGTVENIQVLAAEPEGRFDADATDMLDDWKYSAFIVAGEAIARPAMTIDFYYGDLPEGASNERCSYAPWDATHKLMKVNH
ncbi:energy transducer TonB [Kordiimonas aestuarii]|uniref:energy transducer TonB n=1 Tax=Kordiimonas aestuarii TaxID=1005925 RepID=UPI0021CF56D0|nr:energy transducer TonB [Kordiimonas aestuarii]